MWNANFENVNKGTHLKCCQPLEKLVSPPTLLALHDLLQQLGLVNTQLLHHVMVKKSSKRISLLICSSCPKQSMDHHLMFMIGQKVPLLPRGREDLPTTNHFEVHVIQLSHIRLETCFYCFINLCFFFPFHMLFG